MAKKDSPDSPSSTTTMPPSKPSTPPETEAHTPTKIELAILDELNMLKRHLGMDQTPHTPPTPKEPKKRCVCPLCLLD